MKPFDDKIADNIRKVFDDYSEPVDEKAWMAMQQRLGKKSGPRIIALFPYKVRAAAAIILLMVVSATVWFTFRPGDDEAKMTITTPEIQETNIPDDSGQPESSAYAEDATTDQHDSQLAEALTEAEKEIFSNESERGAERKSYTPTVLVIADTEEEQSDEKPSQALVAEAENDTIETDQEIKLAEARHDDHEKSESETTTIREVSPEPGYANDILPVRQSRNSAMQFMAGSMMTYTTGKIAEGIGFSAGVTGDIHLVDNLSINTGGILVYNQFTFDDNSMVGDAINALPYYQDSDELMIIDQSGYTDYEFMAIDFPLNVKMQVTDSKRREFFVSAGVSSFLYLQQSYTKSGEILADVISEDLAGQTTINRDFSSVTTSGSFDAFRRVDLARFLNVSAGYVIKRESYNLVIEPYMKYPMYGVTSFDLKIGLAGLTLKYQPGSR